MHQFIKRHEKDIHGVLSGLDRIRFRGTIRWFGSVRGVMTFLWELQVRLTQFTTWAKGLTQQIVEASERIAAAAGRPVMFLPSSSTSKEDLALEIARADRVTEGLVCVFKCVEQCHTFKVGPNAKAKQLELRQVPGKCSHYYFYLRHPQFGLLHLRLAELAAVHDSCLHEWPRMAGAAAPSAEDWLPPAGQLFRVDQRHPGGSEVGGPAIAHRLEWSLGRSAAAVPSRS